LSPADGGERLGFGGWFIPRFARTMIRMICRTASITVNGVEAIDDLESSGQEAVIVFFHGRQFILVDHLRGRKVSVMSSLSRDGELQARTLSGFGYKIVRGSASRGGAKGLIGLKKLMKDGYHSTFAVDGPRGPINEAKPGAVFLAKKVGAPLLPLISSAKPARIFSRAWDRYMLPYPFSRAVVIYGSPIFLDSDTSEEALERDSRMIQKVLLDLQDDADRIVGYL